MDHLHQPPRGSLPHDPGQIFRVFSQLLLHVLILLKPEESVSQSICGIGSRTLGATGAVERALVSITTTPTDFWQLFVLDDRREALEVEIPLDLIELDLVVAVSVSPVPAAGWTAWCFIKPNLDAFAPVNVTTWKYRSSLMGIIDSSCDCQRIAADGTLYIEVHVILKMTVYIKEGRPVADETVQSHQLVPA